jgi:hypothetical protein
MCDECKAMISNKLNEAMPKQKIKSMEDRRRSQLLIDLNRMKK